MSRKWEIMGMVLVGMAAILVLCIFTCFVFSQHDVRGYYVGGVRKPTIYADVAWFLDETIAPEKGHPRETMTIEDMRVWCAKANADLREMRR